MVQSTSYMLTRAKISIKHVCIRHTLSQGGHCNTWVCVRVCESMLLSGYGKRSTHLVLFVARVYPVLRKTPIRYIPRLKQLLTPTMMYTP